MEMTGFRARLVSSWRAADFNRRLSEACRLFEAIRRQASLIEWHLENSSLMTRIMKFTLGSGVLSLGLFAVSFTLTGCSGDSTKSLEGAKINGMSPGDYRDSLDPPPVKGTKGRAKRR